MKNNTAINQEQARLQTHYAGKADWLQWGPYLSERQWGTVREDYSRQGDAWGYFPHEHARSRSYRWGEDGLAGISDRKGNICFALALWNGHDPILKERLFGLTGPEGNHGEDVKELYYYLDATPTHSYLKHLYKYPQTRFPYEKLRAENVHRDKHAHEYELLDTGVFEQNRYFDVLTEYAKAGPDDLLIRITVTNRGPKVAPITVLPTLWFRNLWDFTDMPVLPRIQLAAQATDTHRIDIEHPESKAYELLFPAPQAHLFTENETNRAVVFQEKDNHPYKKDRFHLAVTSNNWALATQRTEGTKFAPLYQRQLAPHESWTIPLRLRLPSKDVAFNDEFAATFQQRIQEADEFYHTFTTNATDEEAQLIQRQAFAGMIWTKQSYHFDVETWLKGDVSQPPPPPQRQKGRNHEWRNMRSHDILSMPDKWEYPWFAVWDTAFHCITLARLDREFAKHQLLLFTREWYMHSNGQIPAYEWDFSDVNPPVQAWATYQIYQQEVADTGKGDIVWLKRMFNKLSLNFTWWLNQKDQNNNNVFEGGFLGLDNIGVFDRSKGVPDGAVLDQADGTAWMALYSLNLLQISLEIAKTDSAYEDMATKYLGHFVEIAEALNNLNVNGVNAWDEEEGFFFDILERADGSCTSIKVRSLVGLLSIAAVMIIEAETLEQLPVFQRSLDWYHQHRRQRLKYPVIQDYQVGKSILLSLVPQARLEKLLQTLFDEAEFMSPYGIRSLSRIHRAPYEVQIDSHTFSIQYAPGESPNYLFGGNSNWRGPVWLPVNYLFIQALRTYHRYYNSQLCISNHCSKQQAWNLDEWADEISRRLIALFRDKGTGRPIHQLHAHQYQDPHFKDLVLFYEYFHGDNGRGLGASHQTGWTGLVANLIEELAKS